MPKRVDVRRERQLLLRLTDDEMDILDSAAHLQRVTVNAYAYSLLQNHLERLASDPFVVRDLANRAEFERQSSSLAKLPDFRPPSLADADASSSGVTEG